MSISRLLVTAALFSVHFCPELRIWGQGGGRGAFISLPFFGGDNGGLVTCAIDSLRFR